MADHIIIRPATGTWVVRAGGAVLGESTRALELIEDGQAPVIYFPRSDIAMTFLDASDHTTTSPQKGDAQYFSIVTKSTTLRDAVWSYADPAEPVAAIKDLLAFQTDRVAVEQV